MALYPTRYIEKRLTHNSIYMPPHIITLPKNQESSTHQQPEPSESLKKNTQKKKIEHLTEVFLKNGYKKHQGIKAINRTNTRLNKYKNFDNINGKVNLPYILGTTNKISRILKNNGILTTLKPLNTIRNYLNLVKDKIDPKYHKGVYLIPCLCGKPYVGETRRSFSTRIQEHSVDIKHNRSKSSALPESQLEMITTS